MNITKFILPICFLIIFAGCSDNKANTASLESSSEQAPKIKPISYPISLTSIDDKEILVDKIQRGFTFSHVKDKAVLVVYFATWCPPCIAEIPHLNSLSQKYKNSLEIIGVLLEDKSKEQMLDFAKKFDISYTVTYGENNYKLAKAVGDVQAIPFMILYDKSGKYANHYVGAVPEEMIDVDVQKVAK